MLKSYECVLIFTPVLTAEEVEKVVGDYQELIKSQGGEIVHTDFWGLKTLAYPIKKKTTGFYLILEYSAPATSIAKLEVYYKRDERILRFLTVQLDKFAVEYNEKKRKGLIGKGIKNKPVSAESARASKAATVADDLIIIDELQNTEED
ncbi:30S ribosomal protein S6 [Sphingobacteriales bacterium UPWRP_1]|nr:30S ribosomal protein S6 [Sphingobacteriales bacterium TSM_CSS]PSJ73116.1 30S ribosomal protein S6 [Sphingobacteriales bacterium UPWRP_1]